MSKVVDTLCGNMDMIDHKETIYLTVRKRFNIITLRQYKRKVCMLWVDKDGTVVVSG